MKNAFAYQFLSDVILASDRISVPRFLRDLAQDKDIERISRLDEFFLEELQHSSLQTEIEVEYFLFVVHQSLQYQFYRRDFEGFQANLDLIRHRMQAFRAVANEINLQAWEAFLDFMEIAFQRSLRHFPRERFEEEIDQLDWDLFDKSFIPILSSTIGRVYLEERDADQAAKARLWLQKALLESDPDHNLGNYLHMAEFFLGENTEENYNAMLSLIERFADLEVHESIQDLHKHALLEVKSHNQVTFVPKEDEQAFENYQKRILALEHNLKKEDLPFFTTYDLQALLALGYAKLYQLAPEQGKGFAEKSIQTIDAIILTLENSGEAEEAMRYRLRRNRLAALTLTSITEKEIKEVIQYYRKREDYPLYVKAVTSFTRLLNQGGSPHKSYDQVLDLIKRGNKRLDQGGYYLLYRGLVLANEVFSAETHKSGISWMVEILDEFFEHLKEVINLVIERKDEIGPSLVEFFRRAYINFGPISHFNIKVYFMYQLYTLKFIRLGTEMYGDENGDEMTTNLIAQFENDNNPLSFIKADWDEFKNVPNNVRNNTLNKCIDISKGDLPKAAEHLDFSYRNLRSYITFKEVNRLGFFLDLQETNNRQLEQGIRLMFFDLYKNGTIFEVVFDMPRFLVNHSHIGFYSSDLEEQLNIKGTTAKKYIKIMIEIGLIKQDKTTERKHFYLVMRENIMKRLGADQATLIRPETRLPE